jgi:heat shock protein HtpX
VVAAVLLAVPILEGVLLKRVTVNLAAFCWIGAGMVLWSIVPRRVRFTAPGPALRPADQPGLFQLLEDVGTRTGQSAPADISLVPEVNAGVIEVGGSCAPGAACCSWACSCSRC